MTIKRVLYILGAVALVLGLYGFYTRLFVGEREVNYGSYVTWGLWVAMYLFFAGIATGAYMLATLDHLFEAPLFKGTGKYALWGALVTMPAALITIGMDLGRMERIWKVYVQPNFTSLLAQMVWGYTLFIVIILVSLWVVWQGKRGPWVKPLFAVGLAVAIFLSGGVGALLGVNASRGAWHTAMLPAQFPIFALTSGVALMLIVVGWFKPVADPARQTRLLQTLSLTLVILLLVKAYYLWTDYSLALYGSVPHTTEAVNRVLFGPYAWAFWGLQLFLGMLVPMLALVQPNLMRHPGIAGLMGVLVLVGFAVARANIVFPALTIPELKGMIEAFTGPHLNIDYYPSLLEWSVTVGVVGLSTLGYLFGLDRLPMLKNTETAQ